MIWAYLLHLSYNMWTDWKNPALPERSYPYSPTLRCDTKMWRDAIKQLAEVGANMVVVDVGDGIKFESHPEVSVKKAWSVDRMKRELAAMRKLGLEPIPKLNFSACHDTWLGPVYSRMVSTDVYYKVCKDLIAEVIEIFDKPRFFHLGMDEEDPRNQRFHEFLLVRQFDLWWHDFNFYVKEVEKHGIRAWIWSDYIWGHKEVFLERMSKKIVQSNWYYGDFSKHIPAIETYKVLDKNGYDQIPTTSNWNYDVNMKKTVEYCVKNVDPERLLGFCQTVWRPTLEECRDRHEPAIAQIGEAREIYERLSAKR